MTTLQRLLKYPHAAVFDKAPGAELALRVRHDDGAVWTVADEVMTVTAGEFERRYNLADFTVGSLAAAMQADGFEVPTLSPEWQHRSALVLVEGTGDQGESNGDHVHAFTSLLWVLLSGYAVEVRAAEYQVDQALRQMVITTAEGEWLDLWGTLYGVPRLQHETDAAYRPRIKREAFRLRVNAHAIEQAIFDATGWDVRIEEPWKDIFTLDKSQLSGPDRFYDGSRYGYHLIRPVTHDIVDWDVVMAIIHRNRAAGVLVVSPLGVHSAYTIYPGDEIETHARTTGLHRAADVYEDRAFLDFMAIEDTHIPNHPVRWLRGITHTSESIADDSEYAVISFHDRSGRVHYLYVEYSGQYWNDIPSWLFEGESWHANAIILSSHTRLVS